MMQAKLFKKKVAGLEKAQEWGDKIPIGVFYQERVRANFPRALYPKNTILSAEPASETAA